MNTDNNFFDKVEAYQPLLEELTPLVNHLMTKAKMKPYEAWLIAIQIKSLEDRRNTTGVHFYK